MWQVVYIAASKNEADNILKIMKKEGFMIQLGEEAGIYQIKVPAIEAEDAYSCLHKNFE